MIGPARGLRVAIAVGVVAGFVLAAIHPAQATNATNSLGYSSASTGTGGSGSVGLFDISILNTNPATLADLDFVYAFEKKVAYTNQQLPFGPNATETPSGFSVDVTVGDRF